MRARVCASFVGVVVSVCFSAVLFPFVGLYPFFSAVLVPLVWFAPVRVSDASVFACVRSCVCLVVCVCDTRGRPTHASAHARPSLS